MHIALRSMKVQDADGNTRQVKPGDDVPEAAGWKNRKSYENRGWISQSDAEVSNHIIKAAMKSRDEKIDQLTAELEAGKRKSPASESSAAPSGEGLPVAEVSESHDSDSNAPKLSNSELIAMAKGSLQALADDLGINPDQGKSKLVKAILEAQ